MAGGRESNNLPDRDWLIGELRRLMTLGESRPGEVAGFVGNECRIALNALRNGNGALARNEILGGLLYLRLIAESTIRVVWIAGEAEEVPDSDGRPTVDPDLAALRIQGLRKRDLLQLAAAHRAIAQANGDDRSDLNAQLVALAETIEAPTAPSQTEQLATSRTARKVYAAHRLCSSMIHPGAVLGREDPMPRARVEAMTDESAFICCAFADAVLRAFRI